MGLSGLTRSSSRRAEVKSIRQILSGSRTFRTDGSGRSYLWAAPEIAQFLIELEENSGERESNVDEECFYLGVLSLSPDVSDNAFRILDGVQRMTVIAMFLAFARDRLPGKSERTRIEKLLHHSPWNRQRTARLRLDPAEHDWFALFILDAGATLDLPDFANGEGQRRLLNSAKFMHRVFRAYTHGQIRNLVRCLTHRTAFVMSEAVSNALPDRLALPAPVEQPQLQPEAAREVAVEPVFRHPAPARAIPPANTLWSSARPYAIRSPASRSSPSPANDSPPHIAAE